MVGEGCLSPIAIDDVLKVIQSVRHFLHDNDSQLLTNRRYVLVPNPPKRLGVFLKTQKSRPPLLKEFRESVGRLASYHKQP